MGDKVVAINRKPIFLTPEAEARYQALLEEDQANGKEDNEPIVKQTTSSGGRESQIDQLRELVGPLLLFEDQKKQAYVKLVVSGYEEYMSVYSSDLKHWIRHNYYLKYGKIASSANIKLIIDQLAADAHMVGDKVHLFIRVAEHGNMIYYDLANDAKQVIEISDKAWKVTTNPPVSFRRYQDTKPQVMPKSADTDMVNKIFNFINLMSEQDRLLFAVELISSFIPNIPHMILCLHGEKGASKSTALKIKRRLVDPTATELISVPTNIAELEQILSHNHLVLFDNLDFLNRNQSNTFCKAVTGAGSIKRRLYTDEDDVLVTYKCCIGLNGINTVGMAPDFLDRSLIFELDRISSENRKSEFELWAEFEEHRPRILGAIFTVLSKAISIYPTVYLESLPRMADFAKWGYAIAEAMGNKGNEFLRALEYNEQRTNNEAIVVLHAKFPGQLQNLTAMK